MESVKIGDDFDDQPEPRGPAGRLLTLIDSGNFFYTTTAALVRVTAGMVLLGALYFLYQMTKLNLDPQYLVGVVLTTGILAYFWVHILLLRATKIAGLANRNLKRPATPAVVWLIKMAAELVGVTNVVVGIIAAVVLLVAEVNLLPVLPDVGLFDGASMMVDLAQGSFAGAFAMVVVSTLYGFLVIAMGHLAGEFLGAIVALAEKDDWSSNQPRSIEEQPIDKAQLAKRLVEEAKAKIAEKQGDDAAPKKAAPKE